VFRQSDEDLKQSPAGTPAGDNNDELA